MRAIKTTTISILAVGLLAGSAVGVAAADDPEATGEQAASDSSKFNPYEQSAILGGPLWNCKKKGKNVVVWDEARVKEYKKKQCTKTSLDTNAHIDIEATDAVLHAGESVRAAVESGVPVNLLDPPLYHARADIFAPCRDVVDLVAFFYGAVVRDVETGTTGTDESQWSVIASDPGIVEAVEGTLAPCKEAINVVNPASTSSAG